MSTTLTDQPTPPTDHKQTEVKEASQAVLEPAEHGAIPPESQPYSIFSDGEKVFLIAVISVAATFSGFASNIYFPSLPTIAADLTVSVELVNLSVTSYMVFQGLAPTVWGSVADVSGRRLVYLCTFVVFLGACIGLAETRNYATLVIVRCLQSTGSSATIAIGSGVVGDITTRAERGGYMGYFQAGQLVPVALGPVIGGALANSLGWRSIFWFLAIYGAVFLIVLIFCFPETLRSLVGNGSVPQERFLRYPLEFFQKRYNRRSSLPAQTQSDLPSRRRINLLDPMRILLKPSVSLVVLCLAVHYAVWQMSITALSTLMQSIYKLNETQIGITFVANGVGSTIGTLLTGKLLDMDFKRLSKNLTSEQAPETKSRLRIVWIWSIMEIVAILLYGWTLDQHVYIAAPIIFTFFVGWGAMGVQSTISTCLVDEFPDRSASAAAALNLSRCLLGAGGTAAVQPIINSLGIGWSFTLLALIMLCSTAVMLISTSIRKAQQSQQ